MKVSELIIVQAGRKMTMYYNAILGLFGGALICGSRNIGMFIAGRFFAGMSAFGFLVTAPVYTSELSPPHFRGLFCGLNGVFIGLGYCESSAGIVERIEPLLTR